MRPDVPTEGLTEVFKEKASMTEVFHCTDTTCSHPARRERRQSRRLRPWEPGCRWDLPSCRRTSAGRGPAWSRSPGSASCWRRTTHLHVEQTGVESVSCRRKTATLSLFLLLWNIMWRPRKIISHLDPNTWKVQKNAYLLGHKHTSCKFLG